MAARSCELHLEIAFHSKRIMARPTKTSKVERQTVALCCLVFLSKSHAYPAVRDSITVSRVKAQSTHILWRHVGEATHLSTLSLLPLTPPLSPSAARHSSQPSWTVSALFDRDHVSAHVPTLVCHTTRVVPRIEPSLGASNRLAFKAQLCFQVDPPLSFPLLSPFLSPFPACSCCPKAAALYASAFHVEELMLVNDQFFQIPLH